MFVLRLVLIGSILFCSQLIARPDVKLMALFNDKAMLSINGKNYLLKKGKTKKGVTLISATQEEAWIEIDGNKESLGFQKGIATNFKKLPKKMVDKSKERQVVSLRAGPNGHHFVLALLNGKKIPMLVDTGASSVVIYKKMAKKMGLRYKRESNAELVQTANGKAKAYRVTFKSIQVGAIKLKNIEGMVVENKSNEGLLGMSFLRHLHMINNNGVMTLTKKN